MKITLCLLSLLLCGCHIQIVRAPSHPTPPPALSHPKSPPPVPPNVVALREAPPQMALLAAGTTWLTLGWQLSASDPNTITSQTLAYGIQSQNYTNAISLGNTVTQYTISNLVTATTYFFAVKCTANSGLSSVYSTELMYTTTNPPPQAPLPPTNLKVIATP